MHTHNAWPNLTENPPVQSFFSLSPSERWWHNYVTSQTIFACWKDVKKIGLRRKGLALNPWDKPPAHMLSNWIITWQIIIHISFGCGCSIICCHRGIYDGMSRTLSMDHISGQDTTKIYFRYLKKKRIRQKCNSRQCDIGLFWLSSWPWRKSSSWMSQWKAMIGLLDFIQIIICIDLWLNMQTLLPNMTNLEVKVRFFCV